MTSMLDDALRPGVTVPVDSLCRLAACLLKAPMAAISLAGESGQRRLGSYGFPPVPTGDDLRAPSDPVVVHGTGVQPADLFHDGAPGEPAITGYGIKALLAVPAGGRGERPPAALMVFDTRPRTWTDEDTTTLTEVAALFTAPHTHGGGPAQAQALDSAALLDTVQEAFIAVDPAGRIRDFNRAAEELLGFPAAQACGLPLADTLRPECGGEPIEEALGRLFAAGPGPAARRDLTVRHRDGHAIRTRAAWTVTVGAAGPLAAVFLTDLSAQAAAEDTAERHAGFLTALLDSLSVGVIACDDTGHIKVINRALRRVHDHPEGAPVPGDLPPTDLYDSQMRPLSGDRTPLMRAWHGEHVAALEVLVKPPGRRTRAFAATAQPITGRDGRRLGAVAVVHEVTLLRRMERFPACHAEVERALTSSDSIVEAAPGVLSAVTAALGWPFAELFIVDEGTGDLRAAGHHSSSGAEPDGFFGHLPVKGCGVTGRVWQTGKPMWVPDISRCRELTGEYEKRRAALCVRHGIRTVLAVPVRDGGTLLGVLTCYAGFVEVHEDLLTLLVEGVATQVGVYVALRRAGELARQLTRAQDDFLDLVGHEMRTPLTSIAANVTMLAEDAPGRGEDEQQMLHTVVRNTEVLRGIVEALLDLAALESGHHQLTIERVDLVTVVADAVAGIRLAAADAGVRLHSLLPDALWVPGDPRRLRQVLDELLSNAVKYSPAGAEIRVGLHGDGHHAELHISDRGIGTPTSEQGRVFDRFFRAGNVRHHGIPGNGLGLSFARTIARLHSGTIALEDNQPTGTTVRVRLPL
ncbi:ATP-binding protein [Actinoplanes sp. NEAU-A12]|uniref:histidine kinase n=1 Tax=Actinoplanes sandaracinus TaxID=3045177 RepID=A0ABT6WIA0_9ACTN|nr:ATP-binding protein [Actinoplanes sandaracinus]MDI6099436.1 ATP-binding protein [Actinoplanes sandaracinus]